MKANTIRKVLTFYNKQSKMQMKALTDKILSIKAFYIKSLRNEELNGEEHAKSN